MSKLIAVGAKDRGDDLVLYGWVKDGQKRRIAWRVVGPKADLAEVRGLANEAEEKRMDALPQRKGTPVDYER